MSQYKVRNCSQYNESLKKRGSLSLWISDDSIKKWQSQRDPNFVGAPQQYSDQAILCLMMLKAVYHLPYRQLVGFITSIFFWMKVLLPIPHFTTIATRGKDLGPHLKKLLSKSNPTDLVLDSSGFKVYGEGEWKVRQHGKQKRRRWKKFHIGVCPRSHEIVLTEATELEVADCEVGPKLLKRAPRSVKRAIGDGAYDTWGCYKQAYERGLELIVPPREGAVFNRESHPWQKRRNDTICQIIGLGNDKEALGLWKKLVGYHDRSLVETSFSRLKGIFSPKLYSKLVDNQSVELNLKAYILNEMTRQGMPMSSMV